MESTDGLNKPKKYKKYKKSSSNRPSSKNPTAKKFNNITKVQGKAESLDVTQVNHVQELQTVPAHVSNKLIEKRNKAKANNILVVAHPSAQTQKVLDLLKASGVQEALPSRREQLSPQALTETLLKLHGLNWNKGQAPEKIETIDADPIWQSLVLDLILGNINQPLWAWHDSQAVHLLDFWQNQSQQTIFMLVYDDIQYIYKQCLQDGENSSQECIDSKIQAWISYNEELLKFHLRNPDRSFLVNAKQVTESSQTYLQQINQRIVTPFQLELSNHTVGINADTSDSHNKNIDLIINPINITTESLSEKQDVDYLELWLIDQLTKTNKDYLSLYTRLQAAANSPTERINNPLIQNENTVKIENHQNSPHQAWSSFIDKKNEIQQSNEKIILLEKELQDAKQKLQKEYQNIEDIKQSELLTKNKLTEANNLLNNANTALFNSDQKNKLLCLQLNKAQEDIESIHLKIKNNDDNLSEMSSLRAELAINKEKTNNLEQINIQLEELRQQRMKDKEQLLEQEKILESVNHTLHLSEQKNNLISDQLLISQTELENQHAQALENSKKLTNLPIIQAELKSAQEKIKKLEENKNQHIDEQVKLNLILRKKLEENEKLLNNKNSTLVIKEHENSLLYEQLHKAQEDLESLHIKMQIQGQKSLKENINLQKNKTIDSTTNHEKEQLLIQLGQVQDYFENLYLNNNKNNLHNDVVSKSSNKIYFGAADLVKQQLPYRLGSTMIENSRSLRGWINMPFALSETSRNYKKYQEENINSNLPSIEEYSDLNKAEAVKNHLSYRLGARMLSNSQTLSGWLTMPWALSNEVKKFRNKR